MGSTLPGPVAAGVALLGAAALVLVLAQLVRDVETRPYISIAPVLAVFSGFLLASLRVKLPLEGLASEHAGMFALALALIGGALIAREPLSARFLGWALVLSAPGLLVYVVALPKGQGDLLAALSRLDPQLRMFLGLLSLSSMALGFVGAVARALARVSGRGEFGLDSSSDLSVRLPRGTMPGWQQHAGHMTPQGLTYGNLYQSGYGGQVSDADIGAMRGGGLGRLALIAAIVASAGFAVVYWWTHRSSFESTGLTTSSQPATPATSAQPVPVTTPITDAPAPTVSPLNEASKPAAAPSTAAAAAREPNADARGSAREPSADSRAATREQNVAARAPAREPSADHAAAKEAKEARREARKEAREARKEAQAAAKAKAQSERAAREAAAKPKQGEAEAKPQETASGRAGAAAGGLAKNANASDKKDANDKKAEASDAPASKSPAAKPAAAEAAAADEAPAAKPAAAKPVSNDDDLDSLLDKAVNGTSKVKPRTTPSQANKPAAPTQNERDLDLDNLLKKSVKGSKGGVEAADDPILGL